MESINIGLCLSQLKISFDLAVVGVSKSLECVSKKYENQLSVQNHQKLIELEKDILNNEVDLIVSVKKAIERMKQAEQELICSQTDLLKQYMRSIKGLESLIDNEKTALTTFAESLKRVPRIVLESTEKVDSIATACSLSDNIEPAEHQNVGVRSMEQQNSSIKEEFNDIEALVGRKRPQLDLESLSIHTRSNLAAVSLSNQKPRMGNKQLQFSTNKVTFSIVESAPRNPFDECPRTVRVTPGLFGGRMPQTSPAQSVSNVSDTLKRVREEIKRNPEPDNDDQSVFEVNSETNVRSGSNKNSKGSLNGSFLIQEPTTKFEPFAGKLPFPSLTDTTGDSSILDASTMIEYKQEEMRVCGSQTKKTAADPFIPCGASVGPKLPPPPHTSQALFVLPPKPQPPVLRAAHIYDLEGLTGTWKTSQPQIGQNGGAFKPIQQKTEAEEGGKFKLPKKLRDYRKSTVISSPVDVTYTVAEDQNQIEQTKSSSQSISLFTMEEYDKLSDTVHERLSLEQMNLALHQLNGQICQSKHGLFTITRTKLQKLLQKGGLEPHESMLFANALAESGKLERLKSVSKHNQTYFAVESNN